jgi:peptidyl-prolyl cis-trans isomerase SurA
MDIAPKTSDDPSVVDNKGDLNYFSSLDMVYPFETAAYTTKIGDVSPVVRTRFGYHILKIYDKRESRGEIFVSHIMAKFGKDATEQDKANAKTKIDELYGKLKAGQVFEDLARQFSDDKQTGDRGGQLQPFKSGKLPKAFEDVAFALKANGDYSNPVLTQYGWHIIKRNDLKGVPPFNEIKNELKTRVTRDGRSQMGRVALIERVKKENNFNDVQEQMKIILKPIVLKKNPNADDNDIQKISNSFFKLGNNKTQEIKKLVNGCKDTKQCAQDIVNRYFKYVKINFNTKDNINDIEQDSVMSSEG